MSFDPSSATPESTFDPASATLDTGPSPKDVARAAVPTNPDQAAAAAKLAKKYNAPDEVLLRNLQDVQVQDAVNEYSKKLAAAPVLADYMRKSPFVAKQSHDDIDALTQVNSSIGALSAASLGQSVLGLSESLWRIPDAAQRLVGNVASAVEQTGLSPNLNPIRGVQDVLQFLSEGQLPIGPKLFEGTTDFANRVNSAQEILTKDTATFGEAFADVQVLGKNADTALKTAISTGDLRQLGQVVFDPRYWATAATQAAPSLLVSFISGGSLTVIGGMEALEQANSAADFEQRTGTKISDAQFTQAVAQTALINGALEKAGLDKVLGAQGKGLSGILRAMAGEGGTEGLQQINSNLAAWLAYDENKDLLEGVLSSVMGGVGSGGSMATVSAAGDTMQRVVAQRQQQNANAQGDAQRLAAAMQAATASKLRERNPETFAQLVQHIAENTDGAPQSVYIDAQVLNQSGVDIATVLPGVVEQMEAALATNGTVEVPIAEALANLPGTPLEQVFLQNARSAPDALSLADAEQQGAQAAEFIKNEADRVLQQAQDQAAWQTSSDAVRTTILDQLNQAGRFTPEVNEAYALLQANFFSTMAARTGVTPQELYDRFSLKVAAGSQAKASQVLNAGTKTGEITVEGYHFSKAPRTTLIGDAYGTGLQGSNRDKFMEAQDQRLRKRIYFYADTGTGINPESGVGGIGHKARLSNIYDSNADPLRLKTGRDQLAFESAVLDAGFSGYLDRMSGTQSGQVILLGNRSVTVEQLGPLGKTTGERVPAPQRTEAQGRDKVVEALQSLQGLPIGQMDLGMWSNMLARKAPEAHAEMAAAGVFDGPGEFYKDELVRRFIDRTEAPVYNQSLSSRLPSAVKATEDPLSSVLAISHDVTLSDPKTLAKNVAALQELPNMRKLKGKGAKDPVRNVEAFIDHVTNNLLWLHDHMPAEMRDRARLWYDGGRKTVEAWAKRYGISEMQGAAAIAVLSPQNGWFANVSQAERIADMVFGLRDYVWDDAMTAEAERISPDGVLDDKMQAAVGKSLGELLAAPDIAARWARVYDQAHNNRAYRVLTPEGGAADYVKTAAGTDATMMWKSYSTIAKAISVLTDGRAENVHYQIGKEHKVRNFYNNIFDPNSPLGYATIDTHAVAAALLRPLASADVEVAQAFGGAGSASSAVTGLNGTYPIYLEAYRRAAEARGIQPRQMQSITWEAVRGLFEATAKRGMKAPANAIWERYKAGEIEQAQAQQEILALAGDITPPAWTSVPFNDTVTRTYEGAPQVAVDSRPAVAGTESKVMFEVAPDPNDTALTEEWNALTAAERLEISQRVAARIVPEVLRELGTGGDFVLQLGGYMGATNPSMTLRLERPELALTAAKLLGHALSQDSMMVVAETPFVGSEPVGVVTLHLPEGYGETEVTALYDRLWQLKNEQGQELVGGHTTSDGQMVILNYSGLDDADLAARIDAHLGGEFDVDIDTVYSAFPSKEEYGYGGQRQEGETPAGQSPAQRRPSDLRATAAESLRAELDARRAGQTADGTGQADAGLNQSARFSEDNRLSNLNPEGASWGRIREANPALRGKGPDDTVTIYRATVGDTIRPDDFVAVDKSTLRAELRNVRERDGKAAKIIEQQVRVRDLLMGNDATEFVYYPEGSDVLEQGPRGTFNPQSLLITLNENANLSTFLHESGHFFLEVMADLAAQPDAPAQVREDMDKLLAWFGIKGDEAVGGQDAGAPLEQAAYHGTPHRGIKKFSTDKIGTGEGAQVYGWGLYFAQKKDVAEWYKSTLEKQKPDWSYVIGDKEIARGSDDWHAADMAYTAQEYGPVDKDWADGEVAARGVDDPAKVKRAFKKYSKQTVEKRRGGQVYEVDIPEDSDMLLWDRPLSEQSAKVQEAVDDAIRTAPGADETIIARYESQAMGMTGEEIYKLLAGRQLELYGQRGASEHLASHGIKGIKYLDGTSRADGDGSYNYVIFSGDDVAITNQFYQDGPTSEAPPIQPRRTPLETWRAMTLDQKRQYHERFAESFEQYLMEGKAPSTELQPLFRRFRSWLVNVYKSLKEFMRGRDLNMNDEVRQVFDRMLATDEQIAAAEEAAGMLPDFDATNEAIEKLQARSLRDLKWTIGARSRALKALQKEAANLRKAVETEVRAEVEATPEMQAKAALDNLRKQNKRAPSDIEIATVADSFGYPSVDAMLQAIDAFGPKKAAIEGMTDQRMLENFGELATPEAIEEAANDAVHNEARARALATELKTQAEALNPREDTGRTASNGRPITVNALSAAAKQFAENLVARRKVKDLKNAAWQHRAAEARAGKAWQEATAKGKTQEAVQAKRDQMLNNYAAKAMGEAQAEVKKILDFFARVTKGNNEKTVERGRDPDVVNAARAILAAYEIAPRLEKGALEYLAVLKANDPAMYAALEPSIAGAMNNAKPVGEMSMEELRGLKDEIDAMWHLAKRSRQMEVDGNLLDIQDAADELQARMQEIGVPDTMPGDARAITKAEQRGRWLQHAGSLLRRAEQWAEGMDGKFGGPFLRLVFQPVKEAANRYRADRVKYRKAYQALVDQVAPSLRKGPIAAPEIGYTFGEGHNGIGHAELLHAILHTGNESNKRKLLLGRKWATENADGTLDTTQWDALINRLVNDGTLTQAHYDFAQGVWDLLEQTKPLAQKTHRDVFGRYFAEVTADEFIDPFGVQRRGGYVPAQADPRIVQDADLRKLAELENENMAYSFPATNKGFTKGRVEYNRPLLLDLRTIGQHIDKVLLFSHMEPAVRDVNKLLSQKGVSYSLGRIDPTIYAGMLTPWLSRSARQIVETPILGDGGISRVLSAARSRAGMALMFANVSNSIQQLSGFANAFAKLKADNLNSQMLRATAQFIASPREMSRSVAQASAFMNDRMENEIAAINDAMDAILLDPSLFERTQAWTQKHAYFLQTAFANTMEPIIWTAGYNAALEKGMSEKDAVRYADGLIRQTQGSTLPEDVSRIETGPAYGRIFTQFIGYFNMMANTSATGLKQLSQDVGLRKGAGKALLLVTTGMLVPIWIAEAIAQAMRGGPDDEDDDGYLDDWLAAVFGMGTIKGTFAMVPFVGQIANVALNKMNGNPADDRASLSPAVSLLEAGAGVPKLVYQAITDPDKVNARNAVRDVASALSIATGVPVYALSRPIGYLAGVADDKIEPTGPVDAVRGAVTGTPSEESRVR